MRTTTITVYNNQRVEVFVEKTEDGFEMWLVGLIKGRRIVISHYLTHDDLEAHLEYALPGDLVWREAMRSKLPEDKHQIAIEEEETIADGTFWDYDDPEIDEMEDMAREAAGLPPWSGTHRSVAQHLLSVSILYTAS